MKVARVLGSVVGAAQHPAYEGQILLMVQPEDMAGNAVGKTTLAIDRVQAGPGDRVLVLTEGNGVRQIMGPDAGPVRSIIVGIIDAVDG